jgi:predicted ATPase/class 3 adenylate cyclase
MSTEDRVAPAGTVTMLFTDIEGSTRVARRLGPSWTKVLSAHDTILRDAIESVGGYVVGTEGDSFFCTFGDADSAVAAAIEAQRALRAHPWAASVGELRVRMGLHTAAVEHTERGYEGIEVHRAARTAAAAHGGQVIITDATRRALTVEARCEDLGMHRLKDFPEAVRLLQLVVDDDRTSSAFPPLRTLEVRRTNLPSGSRSLIGRDIELAEVRDVLVQEHARVVTVVGPGGIGKTSLALAAATGLLDDHPSGAWFVAGDTLTDASQLVPALAAALRVPDLPGADLIEIVTDFLDGPPVLLLLDNLEHLRGANTVVTELLRRLPAVRVIATSRAPLRLASEHVVALQALTPSAASVLMFDRARASGVSIDAGDPTVQASVGALCEKLEGSPLAIELAAARMRLLTPAQMLQRLTSVLELASADFDRPERHRSLRATVEWTLDLLSADAQRLFARLAVFTGPVPLEFIEEACGDGIEIIEAAAELVDFSLLQGADYGLSLPAALRDLAVEYLAASGEEAAARRAHAETIARFGWTVRGSAHVTRESLGVLERLDAETWAAIAWAREADVALHRRLISGFAGWWMFTGRVRRVLDEVDVALAHRDMRANERAELLLCRANVLAVAGQPAAAAELVDEALPLIVTTRSAERGDSLVMASMVYGAAGRAEDAVAAGIEAVDCNRREGSIDELVRSLVYLAQAMTKAGDTDGAGVALDEAEALAAGTETIVSGYVPGSRGDWALATGDPARALAGFAAALGHVSFPGLELWPLASMVEAFSQLGEFDATLELGVAVEKAATEFGIGVTVLNEVGDGLRAAMDRARRRLLPDEVAALEARGSSIAPPDLVSRALSLTEQVMNARA